MSDKNSNWILAALEGHELALLRYCTRLLGDREAARDVVQDTFLELCKTKRSKVENHLGAWLFQVCRNRAFDVRCKQGRVQQLSKQESHQLEVAPIERTQGAETVAAQAKELPEGQRDVVFLGVHAGLSYTEIAEVTGHSVSSVGRLVHSGVREIRDQFVEATAGAEAMQFDIEDSRLTAFVLGQLDQRDHAEVENMLASNSHASDYLESLRSATEALTQEMGSSEFVEPTETNNPQLGDLRRARIERAIKASHAKRLGFILGSAALPVVLAALCLLLTQSSSAPPAVAMQRTSTPAFPPVHQTGLDSNVSSPPETGPRASAKKGNNASATSLHTQPHRPKEDRDIDAISWAQLESLGYYGGEEFQPAPEPVFENPFVNVVDKPHSSFSVDVDTASYIQMRRSLRKGSVPQVSSVRVEELINFFDYEYASPKDDEVFGVVTELATAPWDGQHKLLRIGIKAREVDATEATVARDVSVQIEFNPKRVEQYRLIGYEEAVLSDGDFYEGITDEINAGHTVTALYEIAPSVAGNVDTLRAKQKMLPVGLVEGGELLTVTIRYKPPTADVRRVSSYRVKDSNTSFEASSVDFKFASAVASFGMVLQGSQHQGKTTFDSILEWAKQGRGRDPGGHRAEFGKLVGRARSNYVGDVKWVGMRDALPASTPRKLILPDSTAGKLLKRD